MLQKSSEVFIFALRQPGSERSVEAWQGEHHHRTKHQPRRLSLPTHLDAVDAVLVRGARALQELRVQLPVRCEELETHRLLVPADEEVHRRRRKVPEHLWGWGERGAGIWWMCSESESHWVRELTRDVRRRKAARSFVSPMGTNSCRRSTDDSNPHATFAAPFFKCGLVHARSGAGQDAVGELPTYYMSM